MPAVGKKKNGQAYPVSPDLKSGVRSGWGVPPPEDTRSSPFGAGNAKRMSPDWFHAPPRGVPRFANLTWQSSA
jgi:hypothetical protein